MYDSNLIWSAVFVLLATISVIYWLFRVRQRGVPIDILGIWPDTITKGIDAQSELIAIFNSPAWFLTPLRGDVTTVDIVTFVSEKEYEVCHIGSHSSPAGIELSRGDIVSGGWLARVLRNRGIKLVVLNSCESHGIGESLRNAGISAVVTTLAKVRDTEAIEFSRAFYRNLGVTRVASVAFEEAILAAGSESWSMFSLSGDCKL